MDRLVVTPSELRAVADLMSDAADAIGEDLTVLTRTLDQLRLQWEGAAQQAFDQVRTTARHDLVVHANRLRAIAALLTEKADGYGTVDRDAARFLGGQ